LKVLDSLVLLLDLGVQLANELLAAIPVVAILKIVVPELCQLNFGLLKLVSLIYVGRVLGSEVAVALLKVAIALPKILDDGAKVLSCFLLDGDGVA